MTLSNSIPNWQHHSKKDAKRKLKPQALRSAKARVKHFKKCHMGRLKGDLLRYYRYIQNENKDASSARNQITTSKIACY